MPANLEISAVAIGLEKVSFHSNPKEGQRQRMFKIPQNCTRFTCQQSNAQNPPSQASMICEPKTSRYTGKCRGTKDQIAIHWIIAKARESRKTSTSSSLTTLKILYAAKSLQSCPTLCDPIDASPAFLMVYSACRLNKQSDNIQS